MRVAGLQPDLGDVKRIADNDPNGSAEITSPEVGSHEISKRLEDYLQKNIDIGHLKLPPLPQ